MYKKIAVFGIKSPKSTIINIDTINLDVLPT